MRQLTPEERKKFEQDFPHSKKTYIKDAPFSGRLGDISIPQQYISHIITPFDDSDGMTSLTSYNNSTMVQAEGKGPMLAITGEATLVLDDPNDESGGILINSDDVLLVSDRTQRNAVTGKEVLQIEVISARDFAAEYRPYRSNKSLFKPTPEGERFPDRGTGAAFNAPYAEQFEAIKDWDKKEFDTHHSFIKNRLKAEFEARLDNEYFNALEAGEGYNSFERILKELTSDIAQGCEDLIDQEYYQQHRLYLIKKYFNIAGNEELLVQAHGDEYAQAIADQWAADRLKAAQDAEQTSVTQLNPESIAQYFIQNRGKADKISWIFPSRAGKNKRLNAALKTAFNDPLLDAFDRVASNAPAAKIPWFGSRIQKSAKGDFTRKFGLTGTK